MVEFSFLHCVCCCCIFRQRFVISVLCLLGIILSYCQRVVLSIAITKIVSTTVRQTINECLPINDTVSEDMGPTVDWNESVQQYVLLSFFGGYLVGHIPAGLFSDKLGPRLIYFWGMLVSTAMNLATPFTVIYTHWVVVAIIRVICGLAQSIVFPCVSVLLARYIPPQERGMMGAFSMAASSLGLVFGNLLSGQITNWTKDWCWAFYFWTLIGAVWCTFYLLYVYDEAEINPRILEEEKQFILDNIPRTQKFKVPWKGILSDSGIWGLAVGTFGSDLWVYLMLTNIPKYMGTVLHVDMNTLSLATSLPSVLLWISGIISGRIVDWTITKRNSNVKWNRKIASSVAVFVPAGFTAAMGYVGCDITVFIVLYCMANITRGPFYCSLRINHLDMTHNFSGIVMAIINGFGCLSGILAPVIVKLLASESTLKDWSNVFWTVCAVMMACQLVYFFTAKAERAAWDVMDEDK